MKKSFVKNIAKVCALLLVVVMASSCNKKGMGCPDAWKIEQVKLPSISICLIK